MTTIEKLEALLRIRRGNNGRLLGRIDVYADDREVMIDVQSRTYPIAPVSVCVGVGATLEAALTDALRDCEQ